MESLGIWLIAIGLGDCVAGLSGDASNRGRRVAGFATGVLTSALLALSFGLRPCSLFWLVAVTATSQVAWLWARSPSEWSSTRAALLLAGAALAASAMVSVGALWPEVTESAVGSWLIDLPYGRVSSLSPGELAVLIGVALLLQATGNALVRSLLRFVGTSPASESELRGGRLIGPLERTLIFGLAFVGQPTAAALVISAKGLLRFPEMNQQQKDRIHLVTEYFLVGSLGSWLLALIGAALAAIAVSP